jgi:hypothetical protein
MAENAAIIGAAIALAVAIGAMVISIMALRRARNTTDTISDLLDRAQTESKPAADRTDPRWDLL